jgi:S1-C subfamily serine protease
MQGDRVRAVNTLGLEPGDVIVSVDGRKVTTPSQLMRIVSTYDRGDEFKLQIMRQKRAEALTVKMP